MKQSDVIAGLSVAGLLLPEAVAYATIAGIPPQHAIFAGIAGCLAYALYGKSRFAIISPTSSSAAILAAILLALPIAPEQRASMVMAVVLLTSCIFLLAGMARLGNLTGFIARPVMRGFALGLAITIIIKQLPAITGLTVQAPDIFGLLARIISHAPGWNPYSLSLGLCSLAALLYLKKHPALPGTFFVLAAGIAASMILGLPAHGVATVGAIDLSLSWPSLPNFTFEQWSRLVQLTLPLALILLAESWGTIGNLALRHGDTLDANHELTAIGISNFASALVQGMPVGAGFSVGSASEAAGATSKVTAIIAALGLGVGVAFATPLVAHLPEAVLAAVVIAALVHALNIKPFIRLWQLNRDLYLALAAAAAVIFFGVVNGMLIAITLSLGLVVRRLAHPRVVQLGRLGTSHDYVDISRHADAAPPPGVGIWRPAVPLLFANAEAVFRTITNATLAQPEKRKVIVSLEESFDLDSTSLEVLSAFDEAMANAGKKLLLARVHDGVRDVLLAGGFNNLAGRCCYSVADAVSTISETTDPQSP